MDLKNRMEKTFDIVQKTAEKSRTKQKVQFDKKAKAHKLNVGDHVLLRILAYDGKHKIADKFEEDGHGKTAHRNLIIPTGTIEKSKGTEIRPETEGERKQEEQKDENVKDI